MIEQIWERGYFLLRAERLRKTTSHRQVLTFGHFSALAEHLSEGSDAG